MAQHIHKFAPGATVTFTAEAAVTAGQVVRITGDREVSPGTAAGKLAWIGVSATDAAAGDAVLVLTGGVQTLTSTAAVITAGDLVECADGGKVVKIAAVSTPTAGDVTSTRAAVGIALTSVTSAGGAIDILLTR